MGKLIIFDWAINKFVIVWMVFRDINANWFIAINDLGMNELFFIIIKPNTSIKLDVKNSSIIFGKVLCKLYWNQKVLIGRIVLNKVIKLSKLVLLFGVLNFNDLVYSEMELISFQFILETLHCIILQRIILLDFELPPKHPFCMNYNQLKTFLIFRNRHSSVFCKLNYVWDRNTFLDAVCKCRSEVLRLAFHVF